MLAAELGVEPEDRVILDRQVLNAEHFDRPWSIAQSRNDIIY
jgi:hypothetical protein